MTPEAEAPLELAQEESSLFLGQRAWLVASLETFPHLEELEEADPGVEEGAVRLAGKLFPYRFFGDSLGGLRFRPDPALYTLLSRGTVRVRLAELLEAVGEGSVPPQALLELLGRGGFSLSFFNHVLDFLGEAWPEGEGPQLQVTDLSVEKLLMLPEELLQGLSLEG